MRMTCGCGGAEARVAGRMLSGANDFRLIQLEQATPSLASATLTCRGGVGSDYSPHEPAARGMASSLLPRIGELATGLVANAGA